MKKILQRLFIPKPSTAILISIPLYVFVGAVLAKEITGPVAYLAYFLSSYALVITCIAIARLEGTIDYPGLLIFGMAFYSFYATIATAVNAVKYRGHTHPMFTAARISSFTAALVSMLSLEIAMTARFGAEDISFRKQMTALTGLGVCSIVLIVAVSMIIKSSTWLKQNHN